MRHNLSTAILYAGQLLQMFPKTFPSLHLWPELEAYSFRSWASSCWIIIGWLPAEVQSPRRLGRSQDLNIPEPKRRRTGWQVSLKCKPTGCSVRRGKGKEGGKGAIFSAYCPLSYSALCSADPKSRRVLVDVGLLLRSRRVVPTRR